jgi:hypothetical protein
MAVPSAGTTETVSDWLTSGVKTTEMVDAEPYGFRVSWIKWDSALRGTLRIGDRVLGLDGFRYDRADRQSFFFKAIGQSSEAQYWAATGAKDGTNTVLTVYREEETVQIAGTIRAERDWWNAEGHRVFGAGGPPELASDGFSDISWGDWYGKLVDVQSRVLDGGWLQNTFDSRALLGQFVKEGARVQFLGQHYPGPFAAAVEADWKAVAESLRGTRYEVRDEDLAYRHMGQEHDPPIAGEQTLHNADAIVVRDDFSPAEVMQAFVQAIKLGEAEIWKGLFATWEAIPWDDGRINYKPDHPPSPTTLSEEWLRARRLILGRVYDMRVARVHRKRALMTGKEFEKDPIIQEVMVETDPIGLFDGEYRAFKDIEVHRVWTLQSVNGGPWRITTVQGI